MADHTPTFPRPQDDPGTPRGFDPLVLNALMNRLLGARDAASSMDAAGRDLNAACGYPDRPTLQTYRDYYDREGLATKAVSVYPDECWATAPEVYELEDPAASTPFERDFAALARDRALWYYVHLADKMSGIGRFGVLLLGLDDPSPLDGPPSGFDHSLARQPGRPQSRTLAYLQAYPEDLVTVAAVDGDPRSPRFREPVAYDITLGDPSDPAAGLDPLDPNQNQTDLTGTPTLRVHWSRVVHLADNRESSKVYGVPRMQPVLNRLFDLRKVLGGGAEMYWRGAFPGFAFETDPNLVATGKLDVDSVRQEFDDYANGLKRYLAVKGMTVKQLQPQMADPEKHFGVQVQALCATLKVPVRIFLGSEAGHLASTQDQQTWAGRVRHRRLTYLDPMVVRPLVHRLVRLGCVAPPAAGETEFATFWPDVASLTDESKADVGIKTTQALLQYVTSGAETVMPLSLFLTLVLRFTDAEAAAVVAEASKPDRKVFTAKLWAATKGKDARSGTTTNPTAPTAGASGARNALGPSLNGS